MQLKFSALKEGGGEPVQDSEPVAMQKAQRGEIQSRSQRQQGES